MKRCRQQLSIIRLICTVFVLIFLSACGRSNDNGETYYENNENHYEYVPGIVYDGEPQTLTLTMSSPDHFAPFIRQAASMLHGSIYRETGNTFNLELTTYTWQTRESHMQRFRTMMMAGDAYELFVVDRHPLNIFAGNRMIVDIYELIDQDPNLSRDDFFTNVLEAFEYQGQLLSIPLKFGFTYVGINSTLPQTFINRFSQYETISYNSLLNLYRDLKLSYPGEFEHLVFAVPGGTLYHINLLEFAINDYIDFTTHTISLADSFTDFLGLLHFATSHTMNNMLDFSRTLASVPHRRYNDERANLFVFNTISELLSPWEALFELDSPPFSNYIPITDSRGRLLIDICFTHNTAGQQIAVSAGADQALAWELIKNLITVVSCVELRHSIQSLERRLIGHYSLKTSIETNHFTERATRAFERVFSYASYFSLELIPYVGKGEEGARQQQIVNAIARLERYNALPAMQRSYLPMSIWPIYEDFIFEIITAEVATQRLQNLISLWLIE